MEGITRKGEEKRNILVLFPFSQSYLPEFDAFCELDKFAAFIVTDSTDIMTKIDRKARIIRPDKLILPTGGILTYKFGFVRNIKEILQKTDPAAVITFELYSSLSFQISKIKNRYSLRHIVICYDTIPAGAALWGVFPLTRYFSREVMKGADAIVALSNRIMQASLASGASESKVKLAYPGVYSHSKRGSNQMIPGDNSFKLLFLGRLRRNKGIETLIAAFQMLIDEGYSNMKLVIAGDGPLAEKVSNAARNNNRINYVGNVYGDMKWQLFSESDLFLYPSEDQITLGKRKRWEEQTAAAVREAMASGLPLIVSNSGSLPEIVERQEQVFDQGSIQELHDKILEFYRSPSLRAELADSNLKRSASEFDMKMFSRKIEYLIDGTDIIN